MGTAKGEGRRLMMPQLLTKNGIHILVIISDLH